MKRSITVFLLFILILSCGYAIYYYWDKQKSLDAWSLVPDNTLLVYENNNLVDTWNTLQENPIWKDLLHIPEIKAIKENFEHLDSLSGSNGLLDELSRNNRVLISMHITSKDDFDFVFYQGLNNADHANLVEQVREKFTQLTLTIRQYENYNINELKNSNSEVVFSYIVLRGNFVGSFSPILVEDVIRNLNKETPGFRQQNQDIFKIAKFQNDAGNFFINFNRLNKFSKLFLDNKYNTALFDILEKLSGSTFLDLILDEHKLYFNGYTFLNDSNAYLKIYNNQKGGAVNVKNYIPLSTAYLLHQRFDQSEQWMSQTIKFWSEGTDNFNVQREQLSQKYKTDFKSFHQFMGGENALAIINSQRNKEESDKLLFIQMKDINEGLSEFNKLAEEAAVSKNDTLYYEFYANQEIRELAIEEFPFWLLGPNYEGFKSTYFLLIDDYIVLSNHIETLKNLLIDIEAENVWGKSIKFNQFIESSLHDANLNLFFNLNQSWPFLLNNLNEKWNNVFKSNEKTLKNLELVAMQFSYEKARFYTNLALYHQEKQELDNLNNFKLLLSKTLPTKLHSKPFVVKNHQTAKFETLVQDSSNLIHLIGNDGSIIWSKALESKIIGDVYQIDYLKNNKLQYTFATEKKVYIIDRNGNAVSPFPKEFTQNNAIAYFSVVDYDKSKNYRFLISTKNGDLYLSNKEGELLGDWKPLELGDQLATSPKHIRIRSKDFMVALQQNGQINVMSRNGEMKPNFPVALDDRLTNNLFFEIGNNFKQSKLVTLTAGGKLVKTSFTGEIEKQIQLYKPTKETIFKIIPDATARNYVIARQDQNRVSILNSNGELLFDKDYLSREEMAVQYYQFAADKELIVITDLIQQFTYFYTMDGTLINSQPIESNSEVAMIYYAQENTIHIYKNHDSTFEILKLEF